MPLMKNINSKTIVFVTGAFVSHTCWNKWQAFFEKRGYSTIAPAGLHKEGSAQALRASQPNSKIASVGLNDILEYYTNIIQELPEKPIIIGHSFGGLLTQLLIQKWLGVAGIAIHSVPPQWVISLQLSFYKATWWALGFLTDINESYLMSFKEWQYAFTNWMTLEEQQRSYDESVIPESKRASRDGLTRAAKIDFHKPHAPLLFIGWWEDHIMPAALNYSNYKKYSDTSSITDFKEFSSNNHYVLELPNRQTVAQYALDWIDK